MSFEDKSRTTPAEGGHSRPAKAATPTTENRELRTDNCWRVTNERLDEVSNYYRHRPQNRELWPTEEAEAHAIVENGEVKQIIITNPGSGYCSPPTSTIPGLNDVQLKVNLGFNKDLKQNGTITNLEPQLVR